MRIERVEAAAPGAADYARTLELLRAVGRGEHPEVLRLSRPAPVVAFGRRDELNPGFARAASSAAAHGFEPWVRKVGGRAAAYHRDCLIVDHLCPDADATGGNQRRYREFGALWARALADLGVDAGVGELPGEYCPGEFSVHGAAGGIGLTKLVGTAQRVVAGAWWFSAAVVVDRREPLAAVLTEVYAALGLELDPGTVGAVRQLISEARIEDVEDAVLEQYAAWERAARGGLG